MKKIMKKINKKTIFIALIAIIGIFLITLGVSYARYVSNTIWDYYLKSKGFYFSSDYLGSTTIKNVNSMWDGNSVHFNVRNNLNQNVITDYDITYVATCTITNEASSYSECRMNGTSSNTVNGTLSSYQICVNNTGDGINVSELNKTDCELGGYEWLNQIATKDLYFDIVLTDITKELTDVVVNVSVTSTSPYSKTISGEFTLHRGDIEEEDIVSKYKNYSNYDKLVITNPSSSTKCISVSWDSNKLLLDLNSGSFSFQEVDSNGYVNNIKFNIGARDSVGLIYYKKNFELTYNIDEFTIVETEGC